MNKKLKNFFLSFNRLNKPAIFAVLFLTIFLGLILPFHSAQAFIVELALGVVGVLFWKILLVPLGLSYLFLGIAGLFLAYVTSPWFLDISYATNEFVMLGWTLTRDLANMFFILVLVVIALATILRIGDYQAKKTLPLLIIIILLINFTPVIAGIIIDFFNILMRFFLGEGIGFDFLLRGITTLSAGIILVAETRDPFAIGGAVVAGILAPIILIMFNLITGVVFLLLAFLFIMRPIALMMLVILSPIAFLAYILPATRSFWTQWWNQFITWCMIGVVASFFLYLTNQLAFMIFEQGFGGLFDGVGAEEARGGVLVAFVPVMIILGFLILGFFYTISTSAAGASHIIGAAKGTGRWAGQALAVKAGVMAARKYPDIAHGIAKRMDIVSGNLEKKGRFGQIMARPFRGIGRQMEGFARHGEAKTLTEEQKMEKEFEAKTTETDDLLRMAKAGTEEQKVAALRVLISNFESERALKPEDAKEEKDRGLGRERIVEIYRLAKKMNLHRDIESALPHLHEKFGITTSDNIDKLVGRIVAKPELIKYMHPGAYDSPEIRKRILSGFDGRAIGEAVRSSKQAREKIENIFEERIEEIGFEAFARENPSAATYLASTLACGTGGIRDVIHLPEEEVREILRKVKAPPPPPPPPPPS